MLDGITVLHTFHFMSGDIARIGLLVAACVMTILTIYSWVLATNFQTRKQVFIAIVISVIMLSCFVAAGAVPVINETRYKVLIDDTVSYRDFTKYYEVIDIEGEIYTIRQISDLPLDDIPVDNDTYPTDEAVG